MRHWVKSVVFPVESQIWRIPWSFVCANRKSCKQTRSHQNYSCLLKKKMTPERKSSRYYFAEFSKTANVTKNWSMKGLRIFLNYFKKLSQILNRFYPLFCFSWRLCQVWVPYGKFCDHVSLGRYFVPTRLQRSRQV